MQIKALIGVGQQGVSNALVSTVVDTIPLPERKHSAVVEPICFSSFSNAELLSSVNPRLNPAQLNLCTLNGDGYAHVVAHEEQKSLSVRVMQSKIQALSFMGVKEVYLICQTAPLQPLSARENIGHLLERLQVGVTLVVDLSCDELGAVMATADVLSRTQHFDGWLAVHSKSITDNDWKIGVGTLSSLLPAPRLGTIREGSLAGSCFIK